MCVVCVCERERERERGEGERHRASEFLPVYIELSACDCIYTLIISLIVVVIITIINSIKRAELILSGKEY